MVDSLNHKDRGHARLSPSGSERWLNCPGSVHKEVNYENTSSKYAIEGTCAHELAEICLTDRDLDIDSFVGKTIDGYIVDDEMVKYVGDFINYVKSIENENTETLLETRVDFSKWVVDGFGTTDVTIIDNKTKAVHIIDLKYGKGISVDAFDNTQLQMYALGVYDSLNNKEEFKNAILHVGQPRTNNYSIFEMTIDELLKRGGYFKDQSKFALSNIGTDIFQPTDKGCRWCKHFINCGAVAGLILNTLFKGDFMNIRDYEDLNFEQKYILMKNKSIVEKMLKAIYNEFENTLLNGEKVEGFKLVEGTKRTTWKEDAEEQLQMLYGNDVIKQSLISVTDAKKVLTADELAEFTYKKQSAPKMVTADSKGKEWNPVDEMDWSDFDD